MRSSTPSSRQTGYTALEVTLAITVLSVCAFGLIQTYIWGMRAGKEAREEALVSRLMSNELEVWRAESHTLTPGGAQPMRAIAQEADVLAELHGAVRVTPHSDDLPGLFEVRVRVRWLGTGNRNMQREATTLIAGGTP